MFENGALYSPKVLDIEDDDLLATVSTALTRIAAASLELDYPTAVSVPHSIIKGFKNVLAVSIATDYDFPLAEKVRPSHLCQSSAAGSRSCTGGACRNTDGGLQLVPPNLALERELSIDVLWA